MRKYKVMVIDDQPLYRKGIIQALRSANVIQEIHESLSEERAIKALDKIDVDIVFLMYINGAGGFEAVKKITTRNRNCKVIILSTSESVAIILNFFRVGALGFLHRTADVQHLVNAIRTVSLNDYYYFSRFDDEVSWWLKLGPEAKIPSVRLSERELQVVNEIALGKTSREISFLLNLDIRTVETYRYDLLQKFGVRNTAEMLRYLYQNAIIS